MWTYNYNTNELYHHGVKGMRWGVRRAQRKAARAEKRKAAEKEREEIKKKVNKADERNFGVLASRRIARDMVRKGITREEARKKELKRQLVVGVTTMAVGIGMQVLARKIDDGSVQRSISKGKSKVSSMMQNRDLRNQTVEVLGENGKVLKKYKHGWSEAASTVGALVRR